MSDGAVACQKSIPSAAELLLLKGWKGCTPLNVAIKTSKLTSLNLCCIYDAKYGALELVVDEFITKAYLMMNKELIQKS